MNPAETENMAKATRMKGEELASALRAIARIQGDETLAKWVLGVAAERLTNESKIVQITAMQFAPGPNSGECHKLIALRADGTLWEQWHSMGYSNVPTDGEWREIKAR